MCRNQPPQAADNLNTMRLLIPDATLTNRDNAVAKPAFNLHCAKRTRSWYPKITRAASYRP